MLPYSTHIILDAAILDAQINVAHSRNPDQLSLYQGSRMAAHKGISPFLSPLHYGTSYANWYFKSGWGNAWGILVKSTRPAALLSGHFRKFITVQTEDKQQYFFRFYDPRVLRIFLPACDDKQIRELFGEVIDAFIMEDEDPGYALRFRQENGTLRTERFAVAEMIAALPDPEPLPLTDEDPLPAETIAYMEEHGLQAPKNEIVKTPAGVIPEKLPPPAPEVPVPVAQKPKSKWNTFD